MENNRYAQHKKEIKEICDREKVDIGVGCAMLRHEKGWLFEATEGIDNEITEFCNYVNGLDDVAAYFAE